MKRRDVAFFLIGLGTGLLAMELSHMFAVGVTHRIDLLVYASPLVLIGCGVVMLYRGRSSN